MGKNGRTKNEYSDEYKKAAVEAALRMGIRPASRELSISESTVRSWIKKLRSPKCAQKREPTHDGNPLEGLKAKLEYIADLSAQRIGEFLEGGEPPAGSMDGRTRLYTLRDVATVLGISTDKLFLLGGGKIDTAQRAFDVNISIKKHDDSETS